MRWPGMFMPIIGVPDLDKTLGQPFRKSLCPMSQHLKGNVLQCYGKGQGPTARGTMPEPVISISRQMAFYLGVPEETIEFPDTMFGFDCCTIKVKDEWYDVYFNPVDQMVKEYLPSI